MAVYEYKENSNTNNFELTCKEQMIYGNSRIGMVHRNEVICEECVDVVGLQNSTYGAVDAGHYDAPTPVTLAAYQEAWLGTREYEISNHLGNVLATVADRKLFKDEDVLGGTLVFEYRPQVISSKDYYPFGMQLPGRSTGDCDNGYRFGFNGQEKDDEVYGEGNSYTAEYWQYDPRIGRRWNLDPVEVTGIGLYVTFANNPITYSDPFGDKVKYGMDGTSRQERREIRQQVNARREVDHEFDEYHKSFKGFANRKKTLTYENDAQSGASLWGKHESTSIWDATTVENTTPSGRITRAYVVWDKSLPEKINLPKQIELEGEKSSTWLRYSSHDVPVGIIISDHKEELETIVKWLVAYPKGKLELVSHYHLLPSDKGYYDENTSKLYSGADIRKRNAGNLINAILQQPASSPQMRQRINILMGTHIKQTVISINRR